MKKLFLLNLLFVLFFLSSCDSPLPIDKPCTIHMDDNADGICDICHADLNKTCTVHMDDNADEICDICGANLKKNLETLSGIYSLTEKTVQGIDQTNATYQNYFQFTLDSVTQIITDYAGTSTLSMTYTKKGNEVVIKNGIYEYSYTLSNDLSTLSFDGTMNKKKVKMTYELTTKIATTQGKVDFTEELFGDDILENFYNYCPTMMMEGTSTMHIWYCGNKTSGNVTDYIMYRKGTLTTDGKWTFGEKQIALSPSNNPEWDSRHVCDPSVIKGNFNLKGTNYSYLMAYLGCISSDCTVNQVGLAVANSPEGPWIRVQNTPFINYETSTDYGSDGNKFWGYGQPSLVSVDKEGKVMLFYTKGIKLGTFTYLEEWDLTNLDNPKKLNETKLTSGGEIEVLNNADFAYDPVEKRIYCIKEDHPNPTNGGVNWISGSNSVWYVSGLETDLENADCLFRNHSWAKLGTINPQITGYERNHNAGILTDEFGWIINYEKIPVIYTMSKLMTDYPDYSLGGQWPALHTYRVHGVVVDN